MNTSSLSDKLRPGDSVTMVGFGYETPEETGAGVKRFIERRIATMSDYYLLFDDEAVSTCSGDSGGPILADIDGEQRVVALHSIGTCLGKALDTRVDVYWDSFLAPTIDRWTGPCQLDGACVESGCRTPDPDCDVCGFNDECGAQCAELDLDCELRFPYRAECTQDADCESGICLDAHGDGYCTLPCEPEVADRACGEDASCEFVATRPATQNFCVLAEQPPDGCCSANSNRPGLLILFFATGMILLRRGRRRGR